MPQRPPFNNGPNGRGPGGPQRSQQPFQQGPNRQQRPPYGYQDPLKANPLFTNKRPNRTQYRYRAPSINFGMIAIILVGILLAFILMIAIDNIVPLLIMGGVGFGTYYVINHKSSLQKANIKQRLQDLKEEVNRIDRQLKNLDNFQDNKDTVHYVPLAQDLLPQLKAVKAEATELKNEMDLSIYKRIVSKVDKVSTDIKRELELLQVPINQKVKTDEEERVAKFAPEILQIYRNIQADHLMVLEKLKDRGNKKEMGALHEAEMSRFQDILDGYLQIKANPKNYYDADDRLAQAKAALEQFDISLDETLRKLNESELSDFDISLRMMNNAKEDGE